MNARWVLGLLLALSATGHADPFILPWNDALPGVVTDFSVLNTPIGPSGQGSVDTNGHFVANGQRIRFLGVNFAGDSPFMPTNKADAVAARLSKFGVNCVRFHHGDTPAVERARFQREPADILITTPESLYLLLTSAARLIMVPGEPVLRLGPLAVTAAGADRFAVVMSRAAVALAPTVVLVSTTSFAELLHALRQLRLPRAVATALGLGYRLLYLTVDELERLQRAARSRNAGHVAARRRQLLIAITAATLGRSFARGERSHRAMLARGFAGDLRTLHDPSWTLASALHLTVFVALTVTEIITGIDIVKDQISVAAGNPLAMRQDELSIRGWAIESRVVAEDPWSFIPSPGTITSFHPPGGPGIRLDTAAYAGYRVLPYYDSMIGKLIARGRTRDEAADRQRRALQFFVIEGIKTNLPLLAEIFEDPGFRAGDLSTRFMPEFLERRRAKVVS